ncbi:MAG: LysE family translocator [Pseudomonadota bacterium]
MLSIFEPANFALFLLAAIAIAFAPGPGILYVLARTLSGGRTEGIASSFGTSVGGLVHIAAGAIGVSALVLASAELFFVLKILGAIYLIWLGIKTIRAARSLSVTALTTPSGSCHARRSRRQAFRDGIVVEALNPKTAAFFLAFLPQFVDPSAGQVGMQFALLGIMTVAMNTTADLIVSYAGGALRSGLVARPQLLRRLGEVSGGTLCMLGASLALVKRNA